jgi:hypothetical protein
VSECIAPSVLRQREGTPEAPAFQGKLLEEVALAHLALTKFPYCFLQVYFDSILNSFLLGHDHLRLTTPFLVTANIIYTYVDPVILVL